MTEKPFSANDQEQPGQEMVPVPPKPERRRVGVLISGRGSNMKALLEAAQDPAYPAEIVLVLANKEDAKGLDVARSFGIATAAISHKDYGDRAAFDQALNGRLLEAGVEITCLAGFMRLLTPGFVESWGDRLLNIHPALLPSFKGAHGHRDALAAGVKIHGCTVHLVRAEMDSGPILLQAAVPVLPEDDEAVLAARVLRAEHKIYPLALKFLAEGRVSVSGDKAHIDFEGLAETGLCALSDGDMILIGPGLA